MKQCKGQTTSSLEENGRPLVPPNIETRLVGGLNACLAALKESPGCCRSLLVAEGRHWNTALHEICALARGAGVAVKISPRLALDRLYQGRHQGVVAIFDPLDYASFEDLLASIIPGEPALLLALDRVEDPGNLGALMRSALAFGAKGVLIPRERSAVLTPAALRASAGAAEILPLARVVNLRRSLTICQQQGFWLVGAEGEGGGNLFDFQFPDRTVVILGSEGRGLGPLIKKCCDCLVTIIHNRGHISSLNVSVAGAFFMGEYYRQHGS